MKKIKCYLPIVILILLSACKKSNDSATDNNTKTTPTTTYYVKLKINGVQKNMMYHVTSILNFSSPVYACELIGNFATNNAAGLTVVLYDGAAFVINKNYSQQIISVGSTATIQCAFTFKDEDNTVYASVITDNKTTATLKFTEIAADHFSGTFSGTLLKIDGKSPATYAPLTDGEFIVSRSL